MTIRIGIVVSALLILSGCEEQTVDEARMECLSEASNAPTDQGVKQRVMLCHQKHPKQQFDLSQFTPITRIEQVEKPGFFRQLGDDVIQSIQAKLEGVASIFGNDSELARDLQSLAGALGEYESFYRQVERDLADKANKAAPPQTNHATDWSQFTPTGSVMANLDGAPAVEEMHRVLENAVRQASPQLANTRVDEYTTVKFVSYDRTVPVFTYHYATTWLNATGKQHYSDAERQILYEYHRTKTCRTQFVPLMRGSGLRVAHRFEDATTGKVLISMVFRGSDCPM